MKSNATLPRLVREIEMENGRVLRISIDRDDHGNGFVSLIVWVDGKPTNEQTIIPEKMLREHVEKFRLASKFWGHQ